MSEPTKRTIRLVTLDEVRAAAEAIISEEPEFVYNPKDSDTSCKYVKDLRPSCVVGQVLIRKIGVPMDLMIHLDTVDGPGWTDDDGAAIDILREGAWLEFTEKANHFLGTLQKAQDGGKTWAEALRLAKLEVELR